jgi:hypothetical protein
VIDLGRFQGVNLHETIVEDLFDGIPFPAIEMETGDDIRNCIGFHESDLFFTFDDSSGELRECIELEGMIIKDFDQSEISRAGKLCCVMPGKGILALLFNQKSIVIRFHFF